MYNMDERMTIMTPPFSLPNGKGRSEDILKDWVKEPARFKMTPNWIYKTNILRKAYQYLVILTCRLSGQASTKTFHQTWVVALDQLVQHTGSSDEGESHKGSTVARRHTYKGLYVRLDSRCSLSQIRHGH